MQSNANKQASVLVWSGVNENQTHHGMCGVGLVLKSKVNEIIERSEIRSFLFSHALHQCLYFFSFLFFLATLAMLSIILFFF